MEGRVRNKVKWFDDDEEFRVGGAGGGAGKGGLRAKPRFSFSEVKMLLESVMRNRYIILRKFNQGVSAEAKKKTWAEITCQINALGENHREVRQIMKKWADLKCDGKRRIAALRGPNGSHIRKKTLGPVEKMVHKILMMSPQGDGDSDLDFGDDDVPKHRKRNVSANPSSFSYLSLTENLNTAQVSALDFSPMSSPEKDPSEAFHSSPEFEMGDDGDYNADFDDNDDSLFSSSVPPPSSTSLDPLPEGALERVKPLHTYSRNSQTQNSSKPAEASSSSAPPPPAAAAAAPPLQSPLPPPPPSPPPVSDAAASSSSTFPPPVTLTSSSPAPSSSFAQPPPAPSSSSASSPTSPPALAPSPAGALPPAPSSQRVAQMASQSLQQQRAGRMLLASVSQSLELLAQSVQLLVESQQEFVQESLLLQRETVDILRDFSTTALTMLRDKGGSGPLAARHHHPASHF